MLSDKHFIDWEAQVFGFGYGTGEVHTLAALKSLLEAAHENCSYGYRNFEKAVGELPAWLLINTLCHADIIDYGTSPRFGWLTDKGKLLRDYVRTKTAEELYALVAMRDDDYIHCYPDYCNCDAPCLNPMFK